jgi:hypothetical protein
VTLNRTQPEPCLRDFADARLPDIRVSAWNETVIPMTYNEARARLRSFRNIDFVEIYAKTGADCYRFKRRFSYFRKIAGSRYNLIFTAGTEIIATYYTVP